MQDNPADTKKRGPSSRVLQEDFERLHKFLLEIEGLSEVSDDMRELVEDEWPELVHKLPPKVPTRR